MTDVVITDLKRARSRRAKSPKSLRVKRLRNLEGELVQVFSLDANSASFVDDLTTVFEKNVAKARLENRRHFGSPDGVRAKR